MRKELEQIIFLGKLTDTIELLGKTWTIQTLPFSDQVILQQFVGNGDKQFDLMGYKKAVAKKCLVSIDDIEFKDDEEKEQFIENLPMVIVDRIVMKYQQLDQQFNKQFDDTDTEELKN